MNGWVKIEPEEFLDERKQKIQGVNVHVAISPYDLPTAFRAGRNPATGWFFVEFRYPTTEQTTKKSPGNNVSLELGLCSGRLYKVEVDPKPFEAKAMKVEFGSILQKAIEGLGSTHTNRRENYAVTQKILDLKRDRLLQSIAAPAPPGLLNP